MYAKFGCCTISLIVCLVVQIGLRIRISDKGRHAHDTDEVQLFHGDRCRELNRELYKL